MSIEQICGIGAGGGAATSKAWLAIAAIGLLGGAAALVWVARKRGSRAAIAGSVAAIALGFLGFGITASTPSASAQSPSCVNVPAGNPGAGQTVGGGNTENPAATTAVAQLPTSSSSVIASTPVATSSAVVATTPGITQRSVNSTTPATTSPITSSPAQTTPASTTPSPQPSDTTSSTSSSDQASTSPVETTQSSTESSGSADPTTDPTTDTAGGNDGGGGNNGGGNGSGGNS